MPSSEEIVEGWKKVLKEEDKNPNNFKLSPAEETKFLRMRTADEIIRLTPFYLGELPKGMTIYDLTNQYII